MPASGIDRIDTQRATGRNYGNVIWDRVGMPVNGWITSFRLSIGGDGGQTHGRLVIWDRESGAVVWQSALQTWGNGVAWRTAANLQVPMSQGDAIIGFWRNPKEPAQFSIHRDLIPPSTKEYFAQTWTANQNVPAIGTADKFDGNTSKHMEYIPNQRPRPPVFFGLTPDEGEVADLQLTIQGTLPHDPDDAAFDYSQRVQIRILENSGATDNVFYNAWHPLLPTQTTFSVTLPILLNPNLPYTLQARHQDSWGAISEWRERNFTSSTGPNRTTLVAPTGRQTVQKPVEFRGDYTHPSSFPFSRVQLEIWNETIQTRLYASGDLTSTIAVTLGGQWATGSTWIPANLPWGKQFWVRARTKDNAGNYGPWGWISFFTNSAPRVPFNLVPGGGALASSKVLRCELFDPDGDAITQVNYRVFRKSDNVMVSSGNMTIAADGKSASVDPGITIALNTAYKWDCRAWDNAPPSPSAYSPQQEFTWAPVPAVDLQIPSDLPVRNLIEDPSFEYDVVSWGATTNETDDNFIERTQDADSFVGEWSLRGQVLDIVSPSPVKPSAFTQVDTTRAYYVAARLKRELDEDPSITYLGIGAYNSVGTLLGTLRPGTFPAGVDPGTAWAEVEGFIGPPGLGYPTNWPTGTTQMRFLFEPSRGAVSAVRLDALQFIQLEPATPYAAASAATRWFGYFDGDTESQGALDDFQWEVVTGASVSRGIPVLEYPSSNVAITFTPYTTSLKSEDRLIIQRLTPAGWIQVYDSGFILSGRTIIPLPVGSMRNKGRFRISVEAKDSETPKRTGTTGWVEFDTKYQGPDPPEIVSADGRSEQAAIDFSWQRTELDQINFGGYQVAVARYGVREPETIIALITNPDTTYMTWPEPINAEEYYMMVSQIENVGAEQIQGEWNRIYARVDYRKWFLKDLRYPTANVIGFDVQAPDLVTVASPKNATELLQWGKDKPVYYPDTREQGTGSVIIRLDMRDTERATKETALKEIKANRRFGAILLTTEPNERYFVFLSNMSREYSDLPWHSSWTIEFKEMAWEMDYYVREGVVFSV